MKTLPSDSRLYKSRIFIKIDFSMEKREINLYKFLYNNAKKTYAFVATSCSPEFNEYVLMFPFRSRLELDIH